MIIHDSFTSLYFCRFRKYIISRKQCEVPLSVPWNPRNQVSRVMSAQLQTESDLKQLMKQPFFFFQLNFHFVIGVKRGVWCVL